MELKHVSHLASGDYTYFRKRLCEASVHCQEAARAYKHGCEAVGFPAKRLFSNKQECRWTRFSVDFTERYRTKQHKMEQYANDLGLGLATLHSGFMHIFAKRNDIELNNFKTGSFDACRSNEQHIQEMHRQIEYLSQSVQLQG